MVLQKQEIVVDIEEDNYEEFLSNDNELSVVHFFSDSRIDCLMTLPIIESLAEEFCERFNEKGKKICFGNVDIDEQEELAEKHNIKSVPSVLIFKKGELIEHINRCDSEEVLRDRIGCFL